MKLFVFAVIALFAPCASSSVKSIHSLSVDKGRKSPDEVEITYALPGETGYDEYEEGSTEYAEHSEDASHGEHGYSDHGHSKQADADHGHGGHGHGGHGSAHAIPDHGAHHFVLSDFPNHKILIAQFIMAPMVFFILLTLVLTNYLELNHEALSWLPESVIVVVMGMVMGFILKDYVPDTLNIMNHGHFFASFSSCLLNLLLLPPIIFESGWNMRRKDFASQFPYILLFAFVGTGITATVIGILVLKTGMAGWHSIKTARTAFAYGALMSATDPIAALSTYNSLKVDPLLNAIVFGESALNDSVAIVLFNVLNNDALVATMTNPMATAWTISYNMAYLFFGSMMIGLFTGFCYVLVLRFGGLHNHYKVETLFITVSCYLTSACAEMVLCSGIIAVFFLGVFMGIYARPHLSPPGALMANFFVKQLVALADTFVFLLTGVAVVRLTFQGLEFGVLIMLFCLFARFVSVFPVGFITNMLKKFNARHHPEEDVHLLSWRHMAMITHAGLRGAIAMVLCMELGDWVDVEEGEGTKQMLQNSTFFIIIVFLLVLGGSTGFFLRLTGIQFGESVPLDGLWRTEGSDLPSVKLLRKLDEKILTPLLVSNEDLKMMEETEETDVVDLLVGENYMGRGLRRKSNPNRGASQTDLEGIMDDNSIGTSRMHSRRSMSSGGTPPPVSSVRGSPGRPALKTPEGQGKASDSFKV